jgi:prevent-host-death family protein
MKCMHTVSIREARERISKLLDAVAKGEQVVILRRGKAVAKLVRISEGAPFQDRSEFRSKIPRGRTSAADLVRRARDDERA